MQAHVRDVRSRTAEHRQELLQEVQVGEALDAVVINVPRQFIAAAISAPEDCMHVQIDRAKFYIVDQVIERAASCG